MSPVQSEIITPVRPVPVLAPLDTKIHVITNSTQETKLEDNKVYMCYAWDDYLDYAIFQRNILNYIRQSNSLLEYYENTIKNLNGKEEE